MTLLRIVMALVVILAMIVVAISAVVAVFMHDWAIVGLMVLSLGLLVWCFKFVVEDMR